jgi:hypothetical protein
VSLGGFWGAQQGRSERWGYKSLLCAIFGGQNAVLGRFWWGKHGSTHIASETYAGDTVWEMKQLSNVETDPKRYQMAIN